MSRVITGSRLHFGLFNLGGGPRRFGGAGLMIEEPGLEIAVQPAASWRARGPLAERALAFARRLTDEPRDLVVERAAPEHAGLGTGTQLALAVGRAILPDVDALELARRLDRGQRSAIGSHGFALGGLLVDGGKRGDEISPLADRLDFPADWEIVLATPRGVAGLHGGEERRAFEQLPTAGPPLHGLVFDELLPACKEHDLARFGAALHEFNRRVGERFAAVQGGPYAHPRLAELVDFIRRQGVEGVGQSSWGPTIFAVTPAGQSAGLVQAVRERFNLSAGEVRVTRARNRGAEVHPCPGGPSS